MPHPNLGILLKHVMQILTLFPSRIPFARLFKSYHKGLLASLKGLGLAREKKLGSTTLCTCQSRTL